MHKHMNVYENIGFCEQFGKQKDISDWTILFHFLLFPFFSLRNNQNINMGVHSLTALVCNFPY